MLHVPKISALPNSIHTAKRCTSQILITVIPFFFTSKNSTHHFSLRHFALRHFAVRHFALKTLCTQETLHSDTLHSDTLHSRHFALRHFALRHFALRRPQFTPFPFSPRPTYTIVTTIVLSIKLCISLVIFPTHFCRYLIFSGEFFNTLIKIYIYI
jgi:hypothetical protein